jgi:hypothetical protein
MFFAAVQNYTTYAYSLETALSVSGQKIELFAQSLFAVLQKLHTINLTITLF